MVRIFAERLCHAHSAARSPATIAGQNWAPTPAPVTESPEIVFVRSYAMDDGRLINNGWLQELPDPITKLTWDNAALMSPNLAKGLNVETGDLVQIDIADTARDTNGHPIRRELVIAALISPGHAENSITIPLGYGRKMPGSDWLPYAGGAVREDTALAERSGFNAYLLRTACH